MLSRAEVEAMILGKRPVKGAGDEVGKGVI